MSATYARLLTHFLSMLSFLASTRDTVASVGVITSKNLPFTANNSIIKTFRQALALDERRVKFRPNLWHEPFHSNGMVTSVVGGLADIATTVLKTCMRNQWITDVMSPPEARPMAVAPRPEDQHAVDNDHEATAGRKTDVKEVWFVGGHSGYTSTTGLSPEVG